MITQNHNSAFREAMIWALHVLLVTLDDKKTTTTKFYFAFCREQKCGLDVRQIKATEVDKLKQNEIERKVFAQVSLATAGKIYPEHDESVVQK